MFRFSFLFTVLFCVSTTLHAQLATSLRLSKKTYITGEAVIASITITNHSGQNLTLASTRQLPWLAVTVSDSRGNPVATRRLNAFGALKIKVGESLAKQVDLGQLFILDSQGNFSVSAVVRDPSERVQGSSTNRVLFNQNPGRKYWSQKVGVKSDVGNSKREMSVLLFSTGRKSQLYAQVTNSETGLKLSTFLLGDALMLRQPMVTLDGKQRMHVMFMVTPTFWAHCQVSADAKLVERKIHKRAAQGDPVLIAYGDGSVRVVNSIPYDAAAAKKQEKKIRKASDRP